MAEHLRDTYTGGVRDNFNGRCFASVQDDDDVCSQAVLSGDCAVPGLFSDHLSEMAQRRCCNTAVEADHVPIHVRVPGC